MLWSRLPRVIVAAIGVPSARERALIAYDAGEDRRRMPPQAIGGPLERALCYLTW